MVVEQGADCLHMVWPMPLISQNLFSHLFSCIIKIQGPYLQTILRQSSSYDNAKVTIGFRWTPNLLYILRRIEAFLGYDLLVKL